MASLSSLDGTAQLRDPPSAVPPRPQRFAPTVAPPSSTALLMLADQALSCACRYLEGRVLPSLGVPWQAGGESGEASPADVSLVG
jgi:hypothetical protein